MNFKRWFKQIINNTLSLAFFRERKVVAATSAVKTVSISKPADSVMFPLACSCALLNRYFLLGLQGGITNSFGIQLA